MPSPQELSSTDFILAVTGNVAVICVVCTHPHLPPPPPTYLTYLTCTCIRPHPLLIADLLLPTRLHSHTYTIDKPHVSVPEFPLPLSVLSYHAVRAARLVLPGRPILARTHSFPLDSARRLAQSHHRQTPPFLPRLHKVACSPLFVTSSDEVQLERARHRELSVFYLAQASRLSVRRRPLARKLPDLAVHLSRHVRTSGQTQQRCA